MCIVVSHSYQFFWVLPSWIAHNFMCYQFCILYHARPCEIWVPNPGRKGCAGTVTSASLGTTALGHKQYFSLTGGGKLYKKVKFNVLCYMVFKNISMPKVYCENILKNLLVILCMY